jgi:hypothetical protein
MKWLKTAAEWLLDVFFGPAVEPTVLDRLRALQGRRDV